jgi:hypothetical protein
MIVRIYRLRWSIVRENSQKESNATDFLLLAGEKNPTRPIFFSWQEKRIQRDRFSSPGRRRESSATNFLLLAGEENPTRPIFFSLQEWLKFGQGFGFQGFIP